jgi:hypothetical protein
LTGCVTISMSIETKLDLVETDCPDIDEDDKTDPDWEVDPDDVAYATSDQEIQKCPSCLRLENNEVRKKNIIIRKANIGHSVGDRQTEVKPIQSVTTTFNVAKLTNGWTRYKCRRCGFIHMKKTLAPKTSDTDKGSELGELSVTGDPSIKRRKTYNE